MRVKIKNMDETRALRISDKLKIFVERAKVRPIAIDPEITMCSLSELILADHIAHNYNVINKCSKYLIVGDTFLSAIYLCMHSVPLKFGALDPIITIKNKTLFVHALPIVTEETVN